MVSVTFGQIQNMVLADGFAEGKRADAKQWINACYQAIWDAEDWSFRTATANVSITAGSQTVGSVPFDFASVIDLRNEHGKPLRGMQDVRQFYALYGDASAQGAPEAFTVIGSATLLVGPTPDASATYALVYRKAVTPLSADSDVPAIPSGYHMALVLGARVQGCALLKIPVFDSELREYERLLQGMRLGYLSPVSGEYDQVGAFRP